MTLALSRRELEVVRGMMAGLISKEIAGGAEIGGADGAATGGAGDGEWADEIKGLMTKPEWQLRHRDFEAAQRAGFRGDYIDWLEAEVLRLRALLEQPR